MKRTLLVGMLFVSMVCLVCSCQNKDNGNNKNKAAQVKTNDSDLPNSIASVFPYANEDDAFQKKLDYAIIKFTKKPDVFITSGVAVTARDRSGSKLPIKVVYDGEYTIVVKPDLGLIGAIASSGRSATTERVTIIIDYIVNGKVALSDPVEVNITM